MNSLLHLGKSCKRRNLSGVDKLVIHRIGETIGTTGEEIAKWFAEDPRGVAVTGGKMPYHVVIRKDGTVDHVVSLERKAPGAGVLNQKGVQIALVGDFRKHPPTPKQAESLMQVAVQLAHGLGIQRAIRHDSVKDASMDSSKICPGQHINVEALEKLMKAYTFNKKAWRL